MKMICSNSVNTLFNETPISFFQYNMYIRKLGGYTCLKFEKGATPKFKVSKIDEIFLRKIEREIVRNFFISPPHNNDSNEEEGKKGECCIYFLHSDFLEAGVFKTQKNSGVFLNNYEKEGYLNKFITVFQEDNKELLSFYKSRFFNKDKIKLLGHKKSKNIMMAKGANGQLIKLTPRQSQVVSKLSEGLSYKEIAVDLKISARTVETHIVAIKEKLGCYCRSKILKSCYKWMA